MLYFNNTGTSTLTVWPEVFSELTGSAALRLKLTDDYSQEVTYVPATLLNSPTEYSQRIIFSVTASNLPTASGQYTVEIQKLTPTAAYTWGSANVKWGEASFTWSSSTGIPGALTLDTDRGYNQGTNTPSNIIYISPDETGQYTVYNS